MTQTKLLAVVIFALVGWIGFAYQALRNAPMSHEAQHRRAFDRREEIDYPQFADEVRRAGYTDKEMHEVRFKNQMKRLDHLPDLFDVTDVSVNKATDSGQWVIHLADADGKGASLWLDGSAQNKEIRVSSIVSFW